MIDSLQISCINKAVDVLFERYYIVLLRELNTKI